MNGFSGLLVGDEGRDGTNKTMKPDQKAVTKDQTPPPNGPVGPDNVSFQSELLVLLLCVLEGYWLHQYLEISKILSKHATL